MVRTTRATEPFPSEPDTPACDLFDSMNHLWQVVESIESVLEIKKTQPSLAELDSDRLSILQVGIEAATRRLQEIRNCLDTLYSADKANK